MSGSAWPGRRRPGGQAGLEARDHERHGHRQRPGQRRGIAYKPLDACHVADVAALEAAVMGTDAWNETLVADELGRADRVWWAAYAADPKMPLSAEAPLVGYAGGWVVDGDLQILKVGWIPRGAVTASLGAARPRGRRRPQPGGAHELAGSTCRKRRGPSAVCGPRLRGAGPPPALLRRRGRSHHAGPLPTITLAAVPNGESVADESRRGASCAALGREDGAANAQPGHASYPGATEVSPYGRAM